MNEQIIFNLYELWEKIGLVCHKLIRKENYVSISMDGSDWPNRVFNLKGDIEVIKDIIQLSMLGEISNVLVIPKPNDFNINNNLEFVMEQINMAIDLENVTDEFQVNSNIKQVKIKEDAIVFAGIASKSFGYLVDYQVVLKIVQSLESVRLFIYQDGDEGLGCGMVFFDSRNNAGLHMIGTLPKGRGKGIGKSITEKLLQEAKREDARFAVLHASKMGESIYRKLGFESYGELETYKILND